MALIVEDGTGLSNADSYISVADCDTYAGNYGLSSWLAETDNNNKEIALRVATQNIDLRDYVSEKLVSDQSLEFPRLDPEVAFPQKVKDACCILADLYLSGVDLNATAEVISQIAVQVGQGAVSESKSYSSPKVEDATRMAYQLLNDWLISNPNSGVSFATILRS
jgi:hypothetical protein